MRIRAAIFDLDGTLVDSREAVVDAVARGITMVLTGYGITDIEPDRDAIMDAMGLPPKQYYQRVLPRKLMHLATEIQEVATGQEVDALSGGHGRLFAGVLETLQALGERGIRVAIVSNAQKPYFRACLEYLELEPWAAHTECHEELPPGVGQGKRVLIERALHALGVDATQALMVGDRREDIEAGAGLGCHTLGLRYGFGSAEELAGADHTSDDFGYLLEIIDGN